MNGPKYIASTRNFKNVHNVFKITSKSDLISVSIGQKYQTHFRFLWPLQKYEFYTLQL